MARKRKSGLSAAQIEIAGQFNDYAFENPGLTFEETVRKELEQRAFQNTPAGRKFRNECKKVFDRERSK